MARRGDGFRVHYAIADLGAVVVPGGALDGEVRRRGQTVYLPDGSVPLHPPVLSEDAASLLPDGPRAGRAVADRPRRRGGERGRGRAPGRGRVPGAARLRGRAGRRGRRPDPPGHRRPARAGALRRALAVQRGRDRAGAARAGGRPGVRRRLDRRRAPACAVEDWNAEISLLTGMSAAPDHARCGDRAAAHAARAPSPTPSPSCGAVARGLGVDWPAATTPAELLAGLTARHRGGAGAAPGGERAAARRRLHGVRHRAGAAARRHRARGDRRALRARDGAAAAARGPVRQRGVPGADRRGRLPVLAARPCPRLPAAWRRRTRWTGAVTGPASTGRRRRSSRAGSGRVRRRGAAGGRRGRAGRGVPARAAGAGPLHGPAAARGRRCGCGSWRRIRRTAHRVRRAVLG